MRLRLRTLLLLAVTGLGVLALQPRGVAQLVWAQARALPDEQWLYRETRANLERSQREQGRFAYKERRTQVHANPFGRVGTSGETVAFEVTPQQSGSVLRRLIERDGKPVADGAVERTERQRDAVRERERASVWEDTVATLQMRMDRRERRDGRDLIVIRFEPRESARPVTREGRLARLFTGEIFVDEASREVWRVEATAIDTISIGLGFVARLNEGSTVTLLREPVDDSIWLPTSIRFNGQGRALLFRRLHLNHIIEWFDYRRVLGPLE